MATALRRGLPSAAMLAALAVVPTAMADDTITIAADGDRISWDTTGQVGEVWGLLTLYNHADPAQSTGWHWVHEWLDEGETTFWAQDGPGTYEVEVCEWNFATQELTVCSDPVLATWVHDVNGNLVALPAADPALETGAITLTADGAAMSWEVTGDLGQASGFMLLDGDTRYWQSPATRQTEWWPQGGLVPGISELTVCAYDHYRDEVGACSNPVEVEIGINGFGQPSVVTQPDPADEVGTLVATLQGCELAWEPTGTLGQTHGFMVMTQSGADPVYGTAFHRYAWPTDRARMVTDIPTVGQHHATVCAYDFHRNEVGQCSAPIVFDFDWSGGPTCTLPETPPDEPAPDVPAPNVPAPDVPAPDPNADAEPPVPPPAEDPVPPAAGLPNDQVIANGMVAWRTLDADGNTCASCHTPDGIDLAYPAYSRVDILRRANEHVDTISAEAIADMIEVLRDDYGWVPTVDPREYRPFQPGGSILPGATAIARDEAFGDQLVSMGLLIAVGEIDDLAAAQQARDELLAVNMWSLPVGVPFDRFSEDPFFGEEHRAINDWVPAVGHIPLVGNAAQWWALQDEYVADPGQAQLLNLLDAVVDADGPVQLNYDDLRGGIAQFEAERYRSMMVLGHEQRREMSGLPPRGADDIRPYPTAAIWHVGAMAYETWTCDPVHGGDLEDCMQFPPDSIAPGQFFEQMNMLSLGWRFAGWLMNQHLQDVPGEASPLSGHYLGLQLKHAAYPSHHAFMRVMRSVRTFWGADQSWRGQRFYSTPQLPTTSAFADLVFMDNFMAEGGVGGQELIFAPAAGQHRDNYIRFVANMYKMLLLLLEDEIATTGQVYDRDTLVEMLRAQAGQRWYGPVDYLPALVAYEPQRAAEFQAWISGIADAAELATEVANNPNGF